MPKDTPDATPFIYTQHPDLDAIPMLVAESSFDTRIGKAGPYASITWPELRLLVQTPQIAKKGRGMIALLTSYIESDARVHKVQIQRGKFQALAFDVDQAVALPVLTHAFDSLFSGAEWHAYLTSSATEDAPRWRVIVRMAVPIEGSRYQALNEAAIACLARYNVNADKALAHTGQPVYLPSRPVDDGSYRWFSRVGEPFVWPAGHSILEQEANTAAAWAEMQRAIVAKRLESTRQANAAGKRDIVGWYNASNPIENCLIRYGYLRFEQSDDWRSPFQISGSYATRNRYDHWVSLSTSDADNRLGAESASGFRYGDAFDLFCKFEHDNNPTRAAAAVHRMMDAAAKTASLDAIDRARAKASASGSLFDRRKPVETPHDPVTGEVIEDAVEVEVDEEPEPDADPTSRDFAFTRAGNLLDMDPRFLIEDVLEAEVLCQLFGDPGAGKSFMAIDMSVAIASGQDWHGHKIAEPGPIFYIAGEGHSGIARRIRAACRHRELDMDALDLMVSNRAIAILDQASADQVVAAVDTHVMMVGPPSMVVVDTLNRNFGGDENSSEDMSAFVMAMDLIRATYGCAVMVVHHSGHGDKGRGRGSSVMKAALDAEYSVSRDGSTLQLECTKMKDAEETPAMFFDMRQMELRTAANGKPVTSVALVRMDPPEQRDLTNEIPPPLPFASACCLRAFKVVAERLKTAGRPTDLAGSDIEIWRSAFYGMYPGDTAAQRQAFHRARAALVQKQHIDFSDGVYSPGTGFIWTMPTDAEPTISVDEDALGRDALA